jgi:hypothetical protein
MIGRKRGRVFSYRRYLAILSEGTDPLPASNCLPLQSSFDWRFSFSAIALRIMTRHSYKPERLFTAKSSKRR